MVLRHQPEAIGIQLDDQLLPEKEIPIMVIYRNTATLYYRVIKTGATDLPAGAKVRATAQLLNQPPAINGFSSAQLPHKNHTLKSLVPQQPHIKRPT